MLLRTTARLGRRVAEQTHAWKRFSTPAAAPDLPPSTSLSKAQARSSSRIVFDFVRLGVSGRRLDALAAAPEAPVADRWVQAMQVLVGAQAHTAAAFGYEASEKGIISYRHHLGLAAQGAGPDALEELKRLDKEVWEEVLLRGFALGPKPMAPEAAREFAGKVAAAAAGDLGDALAADLAAAKGDAQKASGAVMRALAAVQTDLAPTIGYDGADGYVRGEGVGFSGSAGPRRERRPARLVDAERQRYVARIACRQRLQSRDVRGADRRRAVVAERVQSHRRDGGALCHVGGAAQFI